MAKQTRTESFLIRMTPDEAQAFKASVPAGMSVNSYAVSTLLAASGTTPVQDFYANAFPNVRASVETAEEALAGLSEAIEKARASLGPKEE